MLTVLDPAPAPMGQLPAELMMVDILSPNQTEAEALTGIVVHDWKSAESAARSLQRQGAKDVVLKMGSLGALPGSVLAMVRSNWSSSILRQHHRHDRGG